MRPVYRKYLRRAVSLVALSVAMGLIYNSIDGLPLVAPADTVMRTLGSGLPDEEGIHLVGLDAARMFFNEQRGLVVDARSPEQFAEGHIPEAVNCFVYDLETFLPPLLEIARMEQPMLLYCAGEDCEDSRFLAQTLQEMGFRYLYVFEGGLAGWTAAGLTVETGYSTDAGVGEGLSLKKLLDFDRSLPSWLWMLGEFILLAFGVSVLVLSVRGRTDALAALIAVRLVGLMFIMASLHKIAVPAQFAAIVDNYHLLPPLMINFTAVTLPWVELVCGALLVLGVARDGSALVLAGLTLLFIVAISFNMIRGLEFDCGCFGSGHTPPWRLLMRDFGLLLCCVPALYGRAQKRT